MENVFPERLKQARTEAGMTQAHLAAECGLAYASISAYEKGQKSPTVHTAAAIAKALGLSLDWLMGLDDRQGIHPRTLGDCARMMFDALTAWEAGGIIADIKMDSPGHRINALLPERASREFVRDWVKVHGMYQEKVIDAEMYEAWMEKRFRELDAIPLPDNQK